MGDVAAALTWPLSRPPIQSRGRMYVPSARIGRCLFGPVDHEAMKSTLQEYHTELSEKNKREWNFDFENDRPMPGRYKWVEVGAGDPSDADSNGGSATQEEENKPAKLEQAKITDFMRKRKSSNHKDDSSAHPPKTRRRSST